MTTTTNRPTTHHTNTTPAPTAADYQAAADVDRKSLIAFVGFLLYAAAVITASNSITGTPRALIDLAIVLTTSGVGVLLVARNVPERHIWAFGAPLTIAAYLWFPSTSESLYATANPLAISGLVIVTTFAVAAAPLLLIAKLPIDPDRPELWPLLGYAFGALLCSVLAHVAITVPLHQTIGTSLLA